MAYSGIFTGVCALSLSYFYNKLLLSTSSWSLHIFILVATSLSYILLPFPKAYDLSSSVRKDWYNTHQKLVKFLVVFYSCILAGLLFQFNLSEIFFFSHLGLIVLLYEKSFQIIKTPLRVLPYAKSFIIAYTWSLSTSYPALAVANASKLYIIEAFVFIWCLTMAFDIRDQSVDTTQKLKTFVTLWGPRKSKVIISFIFFMNIIFLHTFILNSGLWVSILILIVFNTLLFKINDNIADNYLIFGIDSIMLLKLLYLIK